MYNTKNIRGYLVDPMRFGRYNQNDLFGILKKDLPTVLKQNGVPARTYETEIKSGGLFGSRAPMLVVCCTSTSDYFDIGFIVNENVVSFALLGESVENTKRNARDDLNSQGKWIQAKFYRPDELKLQQEASWQRDVMDAFEELIQG